MGRREVITLASLVVLAAELTRWFAGLWRGRNLAFTVAFLSVLVALGLYLYAKYLEPE